MIGKGLRHRKIAIYLTILLLTLMNSVVFAQDSEITLETDTTTLEMGSSTQLTISINQRSNIKNLSISGIESFDIISNSQSTSTQIINGKVSYQKKFLVNIMPKEIGTYTLQVIVELGDGEVESKPITITVEEQNQSLGEETDDIFIKTSITKDSCYFGEAIVLSYELYTRYNLEGYGFTSEIILNDFISQEIDEDELQANYVTINGNKYIKYEAKRFILTPTQVGEITIPSYDFQANISTGDFFNASKPMYFQTDEIVIHVDSVPSAGKPEDFSGIVGTLDIEASYDKTDVSYGDSITLSVDISSTGNLDTLDSLYTDAANGLSIYETDKDVEGQFVEQEYINTKSYDIVILPNTIGDLTIEPLAINYFNTETKNYDVAYIPGETFHITDDKGLMNQETEIITGQTNTNVIKINQITINEENEDEWVIRVNKKAVLIIGIVIVVIICLYLVARQLFHKFEKQSEYKQWIKEIRKAKDNKALYNIFNDFIIEITGRNLKSTSKNELMNYIEDGKLRDQISTLINSFEYSKIADQSMKVNEKALLESIIRDYYKGDHGVSN